MKWLRLGLLIGGLGLALQGQELKATRTRPISGTPYLWNKKPHSIATISLAKPVAADTTFYIRQDLYSEEVTFIEVPFYLKYQDEQIAIYVEKAEFEAGRVTESDILQVKDYMLNRTPPGSLNPNQGIYPNELDLFGAPADKDHNGRLFILLIDVRDDYVEGSSETYVAGYFDPLDQTTHPDGKGNTGEIIYIDTNPAKVSDLMTLSVVAHELQHLIHHNYDQDESIWLLEGLSELAPRVLGLPTRSFGLFLNNTNRQLNAFDNTLADYAKVGLWTFYLYRRFGAGVIKNLVQDRGHSLASCEKVVQSAGYNLSKEQLVEDWFIANLLNEATLEGGRYGYAGASIPAVYSSYFHSDFTDGATVTCPLKLAAAQYIQFFAGKQITFTLQTPVTTGLKLAIVKHSAMPQVTITTLSGGSYTVQDAEFGVAYSKITFIPFRTIITGGVEELELHYTATGYGGYKEQEIAHDDNVTNFYINLQTYEALEKYTGFQNGDLLSAIKVKTLEDTPITIRIYRENNLTPLMTLADQVPNAGTWTRLELSPPVKLTSSDVILVSVSSSGENALGYCATATGYGLAYLKSGSTIYDLQYFKVENTPLTGVWQTRAIIQKKISRPPQLVVEPDTLWFWQDEYNKTITIGNAGTELLNWQVSSSLPNYLSIIPDQGNLTPGTESITVNIDRNLLRPGVYNRQAYFSSNGGSDSVLISIKQPNRQVAQAALLPEPIAFRDDVSRLALRFVNIGVGAATITLESLMPCLEFVPHSATVVEDDTLVVEAFLDRQTVKEQRLPFRFFDGVDSIYAYLPYHGTISQERIYWLGNPFPNPLLVSSQRTLIIPITLPASCTFQVTIYNLQGGLVTKFSQQVGRAGLNILQWDGMNLSGQKVASGIYLIYLESGRHSERRKCVVLN